MALTHKDWMLIKDVLQKEMMQSNDESYDAKIAMILVEIEGHIGGKCRICSRPFNDLDMRVAASRPHDVCVACFTSNA